VALGHCHSAAVVSRQPMRERGVAEAQSHLEVCPSPLLRHRLCMRHRVMGRASVAAINAVAFAAPEAQLLYAASIDLAVHQGRRLTLWIRSSCTQHQVIGCAS
jgi:hypothetical protein